MRRRTDKIELVETHNLALCLRRLRDITPYDPQAWRRALIHAIGMSSCHSGHDQFKRIREALDLP
jgi:hypothetical protein